MNNNMECRAGILSRSWVSPWRVCLSRPLESPARQASPGSAEPTHEITTIRGAFLYPPTQELEKKGYYSWPGSDFDAEGRQKQYLSRIREMEKTLGIRIEMDEKPLDTVSEVDEFIARTTSAHPHGLLLIPLKKSPHWDHVVRIVEASENPDRHSGNPGRLAGFTCAASHRPAGRVHDQFAGQPGGRGKRPANDPDRCSAAQCQNHQYRWE